jgi:hypothetical protein
MSRLLPVKRAFEPLDVLDIHHDSVNPARRDIVRVGLHLCAALARRRRRARA